MELRTVVAGGRLRVWKWEGDAVLATADVRADPDAQTDREMATAAKALGVKKEIVWRAVLAHGRGVTTHPLTPGGEPPAKPFRVRALRAGETTAYDTFADALASAPSVESVIEWDDGGHCCCVDVDFHAGEVADGVDTAATFLSPTPRWWWRTKTGGLRCVYLAGPTLPAAALAGTAAVYLARAFPSAGFELLTRTRFPCGPVTETPTQTEDVSILRKLRGRYTADDREYADWLEARGWAVGDRHPHTECPANPSVRGAGNANPVVVHDDHVHCFICAADGVTHGSHTPGHFPAGRLCGGYEASLFALCVDSFTHWEHARHVVDAIPGLTGRANVAKAVYLASLCVAHGATDPRVGRALVAGENLLRYDGHWGDSHGTPVVFREGRPALLADLPAACYVEEGEVRPDPRRVEWLKHTGDVSRYGYPAIVPVWGVRVSRRVPPDAWRVYRVVDSPALAAENMRDRRPRYLGERSRMPEDEAWERLEAVLPGLDRRFLQLLIAAKGVAEIGGGMPPMLFATGPTGAGKSASVRAAAAICGDHAAEVTYSSNTERLRAGLYAAKKKGTFALFDEFLKGAARDKREPAAAMEALLNFTPDSESHMLYVGPVPLGALPVCVWCDSSLPQEVVRHAQIARRLAWVRLPSRMQWEPSLSAAGVPGPDALRTHGGRGLLDALDAILSATIDRWLTYLPTWSDLVRGLGWPMLEDVEASKERDAAVARLFRLVCESPADAEGWVAIDRGRDSPLSDAWRDLADASGTSCRALDETDLAAACRLRCPARAETKHRDRLTYIRFVASRGMGTNATLELPTG